MASVSTASRTMDQPAARQDRRAAPMTPSRAVVRLSALIAMLSAAAAAAGLFWPGGDGPTSFTTLHGQTVQLYGRGLYRYDTLMNGAGYRGMDAFTLAAGVPLLVLCALGYRRGSLRAGLLLAGTLGYFLYNTASMTFNYAYNPLFLVYVALFSASLFAFVLACSSFDRPALAARCAHLPRRGIDIFLFAVGLSLVGVWLGLSILPALLRGEAPGELASSTTLVTHALDLGLIAPVAILAGVLLRRRSQLGYLLAAVLLVLSTVLGAGVLALSAAQVLAGVLTGGQVVGFVVPFVVLTLVGGWLTAVLLRGIAGVAVAQPVGGGAGAGAPAAAAGA